METSKHKKNMELLTNRKAREDPNNASHVNTEQLRQKLCQALICADIPLHKLDNPDFRAFLEENIGLSMPCSSLLRKKYVPVAYEQAMEKMKEELTGHPLWIGGDETTDICGRFVLHIMLGKLQMSEFSAPYLVECTFLERTNAETVARAMMAILNKLWPNFDTSLVKLLMSDGVSYMLKCGKILKRELNKDLLHLTCLIHALHRLCEKVRSMFNNVNTLVKNGKKIFLKSPLRITEWRTATNLGLPPQAVITRWGTWLNAVLWYNEHIDIFEVVVNSLNPDDAQSIEDCQEVLRAPNLRNEIRFISARLGFLPPLMREMEETDVGLVRGLSLFEEAEEKVSKIPGAKGEALKQKFAAIKKRNPDLEKLQEVRDRILETRYQPDLRDFKLLTYAPVHSADIERTFSVYKNIVTDRRTSLTNENIHKYVISHCYYRHSNPEPLGVWEPMLQDPVAE